MESGYLDMRQAQKTCNLSYPDCCTRKPQTGQYGVPLGHEYYYSRDGCVFGHEVFFGVYSTLNIELL